MSLFNVRGRKLNADIKKKGENCKINKKKTIMMFKVKTVGNRSEEQRKRNIV